MSGTEIGLRFDGLKLRVSCPDRAHRAWLEEFLTPWFEPAPASEGECEVAVVAHAAEYARRLASGPRPDGASAHCFSLDSGVIRLPLWQSAGGEEIVFDRRLGAFYRVSGRSRRVEVIVHPDNLSSRFASMRIVRELAQARARANGRLLVHAAALALDDRALLIAGAKGAGKTSLLIAALSGTKGRFIANDRVVVRLDAEGAVVRGMPTLVSVRPPTLDAHPELRRRWERSGFHHLHTVAEADGAPERVRTTGKSVDLSPGQLCVLLGSTAAAEERVCALLFPRSYSPGGAARIDELDAAAAVGRLSESLLGGAATAPETFFFAPVAPGLREPSVRRDGTRDLADRVPAFDVRTEAVEKGGSGARDLLRALAG